MMEPLDVLEVATYFELAAKYEIKHAFQLELKNEVPYVFLGVITDGEASFYQQGEGHNSSNFFWACGHDAIPASKEEWEAVAAVLFDGVAW